tara:strand:+ start:849 stop:1148 length:300 start_codon:yes stop_codon:yes gene_type:complete
VFYAKRKHGRRKERVAKKFIPVNPVTQSRTTKGSVEPNHYKKFEIEPFEFIHKNNLGFAEGNVIKYICRWREKNGVQDLEKAKQYIEMLIKGENDETYS